MASALSMGGCQPAASRPLKVTKTTEDWFAPFADLGSGWRDFNTGHSRTGQATPTRDD